jgi:hypothetical protein
VKTEEKQDFKKFLDNLLEKNNSHKPLPEIPKEIFEKITGEQWVYLYTNANRGSYLEQMALASMRKNPT